MAVNFEDPPNGHVSAFHTGFPLAPATLPRWNDGWNDSSYDSWWNDWKSKPKKGKSEEEKGSKGKSKGTEFQHLSDDKKGVTWLVRFWFYRGWNPTQLLGDYNKRLQGSLLNNRYDGK